MKSHGLFLLLTLSACPSVGAEPDSSRESYAEFVREHPGDPTAGQQLFEQHRDLACTKCHRLGGAEKSGPNLDGIADKYSVDELLQHILEPSLAIKPGYEATTLVTNNGQILTGRVIRVTKEMYRLMDGEGRSKDLPRDEIEEVRVSTKSLMPDNVAQSLTKEQFADLFAYLLTLKYRAGSGLRAANEAVEIPKLSPSVKLRPLDGTQQTFANPVWCGSIPGTGQMAVVEHQEAKIWRFALQEGAGQKELFLDLAGQVKYGNNWGLMCVAFHPKFSTNRRYYLKHEVEEEGGVKTIVVERLATADLLRDSGQASRRLLEVEQPAFNHNGGCLAFGGDGMLYIAFGDGGPQRDPNGYCQNPRVLHGSLLRIDVDRQDAGRPYAIPKDNPFWEAHRQDPAVRPETWAIGFREPWRFSFDTSTGDLWLGDVGQNLYEEVCLVRRGENHGWNVLEAFEPFSDAYLRLSEAYQDPIFAYHHRLGVSVTGGFVYRGQQAPSFDGVYIFGDYETRTLWGLTQTAGKLAKVRELGKSPEHIASFGTDSDGEIYVVGYEGTIFHLDLSTTPFN